MLIENYTGWAATVLGISDRRGEPALCVVVQATVDLEGKACQQPTIAIEGSWSGDPARCAPDEAPCCTQPKAGTDCLLHGHGHQRVVRFRCGPVSSAAQLSGARQWVRRWCGVRPGPEAAFQPVPLRWEHAVGALPANPVGCGVVAARSRFQDGVPMPCIEHPNRPLRRWGQTPPPVGFAATTPAWAHRRELDAFDAAAQQIAAPALISPFLRGDEDVVVEGCHSPIRCRLPGLSPPRIRLIRRQGDLEPEARLDTVLIDADARTVRLTWRAWCVVGEHAWVGSVTIGDHP